MRRRRVLRNGEMVEITKTPAMPSTGDNGVIGTNWTEPVYSDSMGVSESQVPEFRKTFPDIPITNDGRIVVQNQGQHKRFMKARGFMDRDAFR